MAKRLFQQELSFKMIPLYAFIFMFPKLAHHLNIRVNADVTDYFTKFSTEIIKQKREEFRKSKDEKSKLRADNFIELLLEAERENEKLENQTLNESGQAKSVKCKCLFFIFSNNLIIFV